MTASDRILEIRATLETAVEDLTNESNAIVREAVDRGETKRPEQIKKILQARRAVEKAVRILETIS